MMKLLMVGIWACVVTLGSAFGALYMQKSKLLGHGSEEAHAVQELKKTRPLSVPMIADGRVNGYVIVQFAYTIDEASGKKVSLAPDVFLLDEAFKALYGDPNLDFRKLAKYDVASLTKTMVSGVNTRMGIKLVNDVMVSEFAYVSKDDIKSD